MASQNLGKMSRGDTKTVQFTLGAANLPADGVASFEFWFTAKQQVADADLSAQWQKHGAPGNLGAFVIVTQGDPTVPTDAVVTCDILPADTDQLPDYPVALNWDLQVKDANGRITTSASGTLTVVPDITRAE